MSQSQSNPWKIATIAIIASIAGALAAGVVVAGVQESRHAAEVQIPSQTEPAVPETEPTPAIEPVQAAEPVPAPEPVVQAAAPKRNIEDCERYRYKTNTDGGRVVKNGVIGGVLGAGLGAAGGAIGGSAGKGAGIGALAGAVVGTGYTLYDEHEQKEASEDAYRACVDRNRS
jgi:hypothetical protein